MARLPIGALPGPQDVPLAVPQADRPTVALRDAGVAQEAAVRAGEATMAAGRGITEAGATIQDVQDRLARANAEQTFISKKLDIDEAFTKDPDYATAPQRYRAALGQALGESGQGIVGAVQRADFMNSMGRFTEYGTNQMVRESAAKWRDAGRANTADAVNAAINDALRAPDEPTRVQLLGNASDRISTARDAGWITANEAVNLKKNTAQTYAAKRGEMLRDNDPDAAVTALSPTGRGTDGTPTFDTTNDWRDMLDPAKRMELVRQSTQAAQVAELRRERAQREAAEQAGNGYVSQILRDPAKVDLNAIAGDPHLKYEQKWQISNMLRATLERDDGTDAHRYGTGFFDAVKAINAPADDPSRITSPAQLWQRAGPGGDLTVAGVDRLTKEMEGRGTPEGAAEAAMKKSALDYAKRKLSFQDEYGFLKDQKGMDAFNLQFIPAFYKAYDEARAAGKSPYDLLSRDSKDFLVDRVLGPFKRTQAQELADRIAAGDEAAKAPAPDFNTQEGLKAAVALGRRPDGTIITREQGIAEAIKRGYIQEPPLAPWMRSPSPPIAQ